MGRKIAVTILKERWIQMIVSVLLLLVAAFLVLKMSPSDVVIKAIVIGIYAISSFVGGYIMGKVMNKRKFLWGMLAGIIYFAIIIAAALLSDGRINQGTVGISAGFIASAFGGTIGGMVS